MFVCLSFPNAQSQWNAPHAPLRRKYNGMHSYKEKCKLRSHCWVFGMCTCVRVDSCVLRVGGVNFLTTHSSDSVKQFELNIHLRCVLFGCNAFQSPQQLFMYKFACIIYAFRIYKMYPNCTSTKLTSIFAFEHGFHFEHFPQTPKFTSSEDPNDPTLKFISTKKMLST